MKLKKFLLYSFFVFIFIPTFVFAETEQDKTINTSIGKFETQYDDLSLSTSVNNTNMNIGAGNYYYLASGRNGRHSYFRRYFLNANTSLVTGTSYHVRVVFFYEAGIHYQQSYLNLSNRSSNYNVSVQNNGVNASNVTYSITRSSSTNPPFIYDRVDIYFSATQTTSSLSLSIGELTSTSYMYFGMTDTQERNFRMGVNGVYIWNNAPAPAPDDSDMVAQQQESNNRLGVISQKLSDLITTIHNLLENIKEKIDNFKDMVQQKLDRFYNFISDTSIDDESVDEKFGDIDSISETPITDLLTMPLVLLNKIYTGLSGSCSSYTLPFTLWGNNSQNVVLPCFNGQTYFGNAWTIIDGLFVFFMLYNIGMMVVSFFESITSLNDTFDSMYQPQHGGGK